MLAVWSFLLLLRPFFVPIAWALCLAAITLRPFRVLRKAWRKPRLAALLMTTLTALIIFVPITVVAALATSELSALSDSGLTQWIEEAREALPRASQWIAATLERFGTDPADVTRQLEASAPKALFGPVTKGAWSVVGGLFTFGLGFMIMLVTLYFTYTEAARLHRLTHDLSPLSTEDTDDILNTLRSTTVAAVFGGVVVALVQGALGGVGFALVGVQGPVLWGLVMSFFSLLPMGGAALIWGPVVIYLFAVDRTGSAWFLLGWGVVVVGGVDNILRPWLLRRAGVGRVHPMLLFFAILSGIGLFGMSGVVFGPLLIAFLTTVVEIYRRHMSVV